MRNQKIRAFKTEGINVQAWVDETGKCGEVHQVWTTYTRTGEQVNRKTEGPYLESSVIFQSGEDGNYRDNQEWSDSGFLKVELSKFGLDVGCERNKEMKDEPKDNEHLGNNGVIY